MREKLHGAYTMSKGKRLHSNRFFFSVRDKRGVRYARLGTREPLEDVLDKPDFVVLRTPDRYPVLVMLRVLDVFVDGGTTVYAEVREREFTTVLTCLCHRFSFLSLFPVGM